jgi:alkylation response protein AidB-like acyl-CoA dehydrogenase
MRFALSDDQAALRGALRELLAAECPPAVVRAARRETPEANPARVDALWGRLVEMGIAGAAVPEDAGGLGLGACDVVPLLEETGRAAVPLPVSETAFVAAPLLADTGAELDRLLAGDLLVACALDDSKVVPFARTAQLLLVSDGAADGLPIRMLPAADTVEAARSIDGARALGVLGPHAPGRPVTADPVECMAGWWRGVLGCAAQLIGLARTLLELTASYVTERHQFGVPVGSFQAIKHHLANALIAVEFAAPAVMRAAWSLDQGGARSARRDIAMAKALSSDAAERVAGIALQCHGAIAYTTEYDLHLFAKRVWASSRTWGNADTHRAFIAGTLGLPGDREQEAA